MISINKLSIFNITFDNQLDLFIIYYNKFELYYILNIDKSKMICIFIYQIDNIFDITTKNGWIFKLLQFSICDFISSSKIQRKSQYQHQKWKWAEHSWVMNQFSWAELSKGNFDSAHHTLSYLSINSWRFEMTHKQDLIFLAQLSSAHEHSWASYRNSSIIIYNLSLSYSNIFMNNHSFRFINDSNKD